MAGFPQVPEIRGDTDDDASIHLFSRIGPSKPLARQKYDHQIMDILHGESSDASQANFNARTLNSKFEAFAQSFNSGSESDTQVEEDRLQRRALKEKHKRNTLKRRLERPLEAPQTKWFQGFIQLPAVLTLFGFLVGLFFISRAPRPTQPQNVTIADPTLAGLHDRINALGQSISSIKDWSLSVDLQLDQMESKQNTFIDNMKHELDHLGLQLDELSSQLMAGKSVFEVLKSDIQECQKNLATIETLSSDPEALQQRINEISLQLSKLSKIKDDFTDSKSDIIASFVEALPQHVPIYMKNGQIHYLPEFQRFLFQFVEKFGKTPSGHYGWESFLQDNEKEFSDYVQTLIDQFADKVDLLPREELEALLNAKLSLQESVVKLALNGLIEKLDLSRNVTNIDISQSSNKVVLDGLIDIIGKGSLKVNYADYKLGSRILGFLTSTGRASLEGPSIARKLFLGWYDYFASSGISASNLRFNANTVLVDGGMYWQCTSSHCSLGIRLSTPIILTDLILRNPSLERPPGLKLPTAISIFVKPKRKKQAKLIEEYTRNLNFQEKTLDNKYASKFLKIQEVHWLNPSSVEHIKLPVSLINMKILVRDLYIEIKLHQGNTGLFNLKAYGLTEFNSLRLNEDFESVLDILSKEEEFNKNLIYFEDDELS